jgi:hypothetical protein
VRWTGAERVKWRGGEGARGRGGVGGGHAKNKTSPQDDTHRRVRESPFVGHICRLFTRTPGRNLLAISACSIIIGFCTHTQRERERETCARRKQRATHVGANPQGKIPEKSYAGRRRNIKTKRAKRLFQM